MMRMRNRSWAWFVLPSLLAALSAPAESRLVLLDGQVLSGGTVRLEGDLYLLTLESGEVLPLPAALVREVQDDPSQERRAEGTSTEGRAEESGGSLEGPGSVAEEALQEPEEEYGVPERPVPDDVLSTDWDGVSRFRDDLVNPDWLPQSAQEEQPLLDLFDPSMWNRSILDPNWRGESGFELPEGEPPSRPARWNPASRRSIWKPEDGFADDDR